MHINCIRFQVQLHPFAIPIVLNFMTNVSGNQKSYMFLIQLLYTSILQIFLLSLKSGSFLRKSSQWRLAIEVLSEAKLSGGESVNFHWQKITTSPHLTTKQWFMMVYGCGILTSDFVQTRYLNIVLENTPLVYPIVL